MFSTIFVIKIEHVEQSPRKEKFPILPKYFRLVGSLSSTHFIGRRKKAKRTLQRFRNIAGHSGGVAPSRDKRCHHHGFGQLLPFTIVHCQIGFSCLPARSVG
jgi:hypothetical protein